MTSLNRQPCLRLHSLSPDSRYNVSSNIRRKFNSDVSSQQCLKNLTIKLIANDEDIINQSSNLIFHFHTLVPQNSPDPSYKKRTFDFNTICEEKLKVETKPQSSIKTAILERIKKLKTSNQQPPNYLKSLINRDCIIESVIKCAEIHIEHSKPIELHVDTKFNRQKEDPKKAEIRNSINKWTHHFKTQREVDGDIEFQNDIRNNLNKLTPDNYEIIRGIIVDRVRNSQQKCEFLVNKLIDKAWNELKYTKVYAELCSFLQNAKELECEEEASAQLETSAKLKKRKNIFRSLLLAKIQSCFEEHSQKSVENELNCDETLAKLKKKKILGIVKFIGELYLIKVLPEIIIQLCATTLFLKAHEEFKKHGITGLNGAFENNIEGIIALYDKVGKELEKNADKMKKLSKNDKLINLLKQEILSKNTEKFSTKDQIFSYAEIFNLLEFLMKNIKLDNRSYYLIQNLLEKRNSQWKDGVLSNEIPKKISELHQEYKNEHIPTNSLQGHQGHPPKNKIVIPTKIVLEYKPKKHCSTMSTETKSTESGTPKSINDSYGIDSKIRKCFLKYKTNPSTYTKDKVYACLKKILFHSNNKKLVLSKFFESFYNNISANAEQLLYIPYKFYEEKYISKSDFIDAYNQSIKVIWEDVGDYPKLLEFMSMILMDFTKNNVCRYEDIEINEELMKEHEEFAEVCQGLLKHSLDRLEEQKLKKKVKESMKGSLQRLMKKMEVYSI